MFSVAFYIPRSVDVKRHTMMHKNRRETSKPRQPKIKMKHGNVQRVEDKAWLTSRWVGDFS